MSTSDVTHACLMSHNVTHCVLASDIMRAGMTSHQTSRFDWVPHPTHLWLSQLHQHDLTPPSGDVSPGAVMSPWWQGQPGLWQGPLLGQGRGGAPAAGAQGMHAGSGQSGGSCALTTEGARQGSSGGPCKQEESRAVRLHARPCLYLHPAPAPCSSPAPASSCCVLHLLHVLPAPCPCTFSLSSTAPAPTCPLPCPGSWGTRVTFGFGEQRYPAWAPFFQGPQWGVGAEPSSLWAGADTGRDPAQVTQRGSPNEPCGLNKLCSTGNRQLHLCCILTEFSLQFHCTPTTCPSHPKSMPHCIVIEFQLHPCYSPSCIPAASALQCPAWSWGSSRMAQLPTPKQCSGVGTVPCTPGTPSIPSPTALVLWALLNFPFPARRL